MMPDLLWRIVGVSSQGIQNQYVNGFDPLRQQGGGRRRKGNRVLWIDKRTVFPMIIQ